jgi:hypothetical protein
MPSLDFWIANFKKFLNNKFVTMKTIYLYANGKLRETIYSLAVDPDDIRKRLARAYRAFLFNLKTEHFPEKLKSDWEWIQKELKKFGPDERVDGSIFRGPVENTCSRIKNKTGVKIAQRLMDMYINLENS